jgi:hypothetical protein
MAGGDNSISPISTMMKLVWWLYPYVLSVKFGGEFPRWREVAMDGRRSRRVFGFIEERVTKGLSLARLAEVTVESVSLCTSV